MLLEAIYPLLAADTALMAVVTGGIFKSSLPEGACRPALTYGAAGGSGQPTFNTPGMQKARIEFNAFAASREQAAAALNLLRILLNGYQGVLGNGIRLQNVELINPEPMDFPIEEYPRDFRCMSEFYFYFVFVD